MARVFLFTCVLHRAWQKQKLQEPTLFTFSIFRQLCISLLRLKYFTLYTFVLYPVFFVVNWFSNVLYSFEFLTFPKTVNSEHKHFSVGLYTGGGGLLYGITFVSGVLHTCYSCISTKWNGIRQKKHGSCSKAQFFYVTANKTRGVFLNSGPLPLLRI